MCQVQKEELKNLLFSLLDDSLSSPSSDTAQKTIDEIKEYWDMLEPYQQSLVHHRIKHHISTFPNEYDIWKEILGLGRSDTDEINAII